MVGGRMGSFRLVRSGVHPQGSIVDWVDRDVDPGATYVYRITPSGTTAVLGETKPVRVPIAAAALEQNVPNPFNPTTSIVFYVPDGRPVDVALEVFDVRGRRVATILRQRLKPGRYRVEWDGRDDRGEPVSSGVYFYRLRMPGFSQTRKMTLLK
jgi:hypothetical protein